MGMIKSDREYTVSKEKVNQLNNTVVDKNLNIDPRLRHLAEMGPKAFALQIQEEIEEYEEIKKGNIPEYIKTFENIGLLLIALRIKKGMTQADLAKELGVAASQVSRDENNDYYGTSVSTIKKILKILDTELKFNL